MTQQNEDATERVPSGIAGLDIILRGGFMLGGMYILQGSPGAGKTILTNQICFNHVAAGGRALFVTLLAENHARMIANLRGLSFFDESQIPDRLTYLSAFNDMRDGGLKGAHHPAPTRNPEGSRNPAGHRRSGLGSRQRARRPGVQNLHS